MPKLPSLTGKQVAKLLAGNGFLLDHTTGSHQIFRDPISLKIVTVPFRRRSLPKGTLLSILRQAGIDTADIRK